MFSTILWSPCGDANSFPRAPWPPNPEPDLIWTDHLIYGWTEKYFRIFSNTKFSDMGSICFLDFPPESHPTVKFMESQKTGLQYTHCNGGVLVICWEKINARAAWIRWHIFLKKFSEVTLEKKQKYNHFPSYNPANIMQMEIFLVLFVRHINIFGGKGLCLHVCQVKYPATSRDA